MDVTCDKCGAEYEFDETLLGDKGATVKCSSCNHVFRVLGRKEPGRAALKLRFASSGRVETLSSLRELQLRVRNGEVSAEDMLGRDGFEYRRLGDVPELKNFFARPAGPSGTLGPVQAGRHVQVSETSMPPVSKDNPQDNKAAKRTMVGVGPLNPHIPGPPRMPTIPGGLPAPSARPAPGADAGRLGGAPISSIPTNPNARSATGGMPAATTPAPSPQAGYEPRRAPVSQAPTTAGSLPQPAPLAPSLASEAPPIARPLGNTPRALAGGPSVAPIAQGPAPVKLYLSDDEAPPARATAGSSKIWLYAGLAVVLGGAGWVGVSMLGKSGAGADPSPAAVPRVETPAPAPAAEPTPAPSAPVAAQPGATPVVPAANPAAAKREPERAPAAAPAPEPEEAPSAGESDKRRAHESRGGSSGSSSSSGKDPTDYSGWVSRGDQLTSRGDLAGARQAYESALALRGTGSEANTGLGFALLADGRARDAIPHFDRAADSGYAEANIGLGDAYRKLGQKSSAIEAYQNYLERLPTGSKANYARTQVETLKGAAAAGGSTEEAREPANNPGSADEYKPAGEMNAPSAEPSGESTP